MRLGFLKQPWEFGVLSHSCNVLYHRTERATASQLCGGRSRGSSASGRGQRLGSGPDHSTRCCAIVPVVVFLLPTSVGEPAMVQVVLNFLWAVMNFRCIFMVARQQRGMLVPPDCFTCQLWFGAGEVGDGHSLQSSLSYVSALSNRAQARR